MPNTSTRAAERREAGADRLRLGHVAGQPSQSWVTRPTSLARSRATAESGSAATAVATEIAAATAAPASTGRRIAASRSGGRRTISTSTPSPIAVCAT